MIGGETKCLLQAVKTLHFAVFDWSDFRDGRDRAGLTWPGFQTPTILAHAQTIFSVLGRLFSSLFN